MLENVFTWLKNHSFEIFGAVTGLFSVYFSIRRSFLVWLLGMLSSAIFIYVYFSTRFYAGSILQLYYVFLCFYGLYLWKIQKKEDRIVVSNIPRKQLFISLIILLLATTFLGLFLKFYTDSPIPIPDAFTTVASFIASWMLAKKFIEQWFVWLIVDAISVGMFISQGLYATAMLFAIYFLMGCFGYLEWKKELLRFASQQ